MLMLCEVRRNRTKYRVVREIPPPPAPLFVGMASGLLILAGFLFVTYQIAKVIP